MEEYLGKPILNGERAQRARRNEQGFGGVECQRRVSRGIEEIWKNTGNVLSYLRLYTTVIPDILSIVLNPTSCNKQLFRIGGGLKQI